MSEFIAVRRSLNISNKDLLFFDRVKIMGLERQYEELLTFDPKKATSIEYLIEENFLIDAPDTLSDLIEYAASAREDANNMILIDFDYAGLAKKSLRLPPGTERLISSIDNLLFEDDVAISSLSTPIPTSLMVRLYDGYPDLGIGDSDLSGIVHFPVASLLLNSFPIPSSNIPADQIRSVRHDKAVLYQLVSLRRWMRKLVTEQHTVYEMHSELEELVNELRQQMEVNHIASKLDVLQTVLAMPIDMIEQVQSLEPETGIHTLFSIHLEKAELLVAEILFPGKEVMCVDPV